MPLFLNRSRTGSQNPAEYCSSCDKPRALDRSSPSQSHASSQNPTRHPLLRIPIGSSYSVVAASRVRQSRSFGRTLPPPESPGLSTHGRSEYFGVCRWKLAREDRGAHAKTQRRKEGCGLCEGKEGPPETRMKRPSVVWVIRISCLGFRYSSTALWHNRARPFRSR